MRPNTIHAVYTLSSLVVHGGHFFSTSTMRDSLAATLHTCILNRLITNTYHSPAYTLICHMIDLYHHALIKCNMDNNSELLLFWKQNYSLTLELDSTMAHIPDVSTPDGLIDLLSICSLGKLLNVVDFRTYVETDFKMTYHQH